MCTIPNSFSANTGSFVYRVHRAAHVKTIFIGKLFLIEDER